MRKLRCNPCGITCFLTGQSSILEWILCKKTFVLETRKHKEVHSWWMRTINSPMWNLLIKEQCKGHKFFHNLLRCLSCNCNNITFTCMMHPHIYSYVLIITSHINSYKKKKLGNSCY